MNRTKHAAPGHSGPADPPAKRRTHPLTAERIGETPDQRKARSERAGVALDALAAMGGIASIPDPSAWQREIRKGRALPGRRETPEQRAARIARAIGALERLAEMGAFDHIADPGEWQREIREDRPLPGRDD